MNHFLTLAVFGLLAGCTIPLLRTGSGTVAVPLLYACLLQLHPPGSPLHRMAMHMAVGTATCVLVVTALAACRTGMKTQDIRWRQAWPWCACAATGALAGAQAALLLSPFRLRLLFVLYLAALITDCALRFDRLAQQQPAHGILPARLPRRLPAAINVLALLAAGSITAGAGVGGAAMTVPLMQSQGHALPGAAVLSRLLASCGGLAAMMAYLCATPATRTTSPGLVGYVDLGAAAVMSIAALSGMRVAARWDGALPEKTRIGLTMTLLLAALWKMAV